MIKPCLVTIIWLQLLKTFTIFLESVHSTENGCVGYNLISACYSHIQNENNKTLFSHHCLVAIVENFYVILEHVHSTEMGMWAIKRHLQKYECVNGAFSHIVVSLGRLRKCTIASQERQLSTFTKHVTSVS